MTKEEKWDVMMLCVDSVLANFKYQLSIVRNLNNDLISAMNK